MDIEKHAKQFIEDVKKRSINAGQRVTGKTLKELKVIKLNENHVQVEGFDYTGTLEVGRKGGKIPYNFKDILIKWAKAKGISFQNDRQRNSWAYFVAKKIAREGTLRHKKNVDIFTTPLKDLDDRITKEASVFYTKQIENLIYTPK
jgi:hypothetical protein